MTALLLLLAVAADAPLGPYARPGVPVPLRAPPGDYALDGWPLRVGAQGEALAAVPRLPCVLRDASNAELFRLLPVPEGKRMVALLGDAPADFESRLPDSVLVRLRPDAIPESWRALDLFDRLFCTSPLDARMRGVLGDWVRMGGSLAIVGELPGARGLGEVFEAADLEALLRAAGPAAPHPAAPASNLRPDLYALVKRPGPSPAPLRAARLLVLPGAAAAALLLLLAASGRLAPRAFLLQMAILVAAGAALGLLLPPRGFRPLARGVIEEVVRTGRGERTRVFEVAVSLGREVPFAPPPGAVPMLFARQSASAPWGAEIPPRAIRIWLAAEREGGGPDGDFAAPAATGGDPPLLARRHAPVVSEFD